MNLHGSSVLYANALGYGIGRCWETWFVTIEHVYIDFNDYMTLWYHDKNSKVKNMGFEEWNVTDVY